MQILSNIDDIYESSSTHHLALSHSIKAQIVQHLILPFETVEATNDYWNDYKCYLLIIDSLDTDKEINETLINAGMPDALKRVIECHEYGIVLVDHDLDSDKSTQPRCYLLTMSITCDDGSGNYLLLPLINQSKYKNEMLHQFNLEQMAH